MTNDFWNERYSANEYIFGTEPNEYFRSMIDTLKPGKILIPAAGEGRDAVYAARLGWEVIAFDLSSVGKKKAMELAELNKVNIEYQICDLKDFDFGIEEYDVIAPIYFHLPSEIRKMFYNKIKQSLKINGCLILEAFNRRQLENNSGGPKDLDMLLTKEILENELLGLRIIENNESEITLKEGGGHVGKANVVRVYAVRK